MHEQSVVHRGWPAWQGIVLLGLTHAVAVQAAPKDTGTVETPEARTSRDEFAVRTGVEWGSLSAPTPTTGHYLRPDGSANVSFTNTDKDFDLIAGRLEVAGVTRLPRGLAFLIGFRGVLGSFPTESRSLVVAGVPLEYASQPMFLALAAGLEFQFIRRALGIGIDLGWAGSWDAGGHAAPAELELTRFGSSGPSVRFSALARLPWAGRYGCGLFAAFDAYFASGVGQWVAATSRTAVGAFFEWDASR